MNQIHFETGRMFYDSPLDGPEECSHCGTQISNGDEFKEEFNDECSRVWFFHLDCHEVRKP